MTISGCIANYEKKKKPKEKKTDVLKYDIQFVKFKFRLEIEIQISSYFGKILILYICIFPIKWMELNFLIL